LHPAEITEAMASAMADVFTEVVIAPSYEPAAVAVLAEKKNLRVLVCEGGRRGAIELRPISGGLLIQQPDVLNAEGDDPASWTLACGDAVDAATLADLAFAWRACRSSPRATTTACSLG
jgi:phosphoribosylaminoimidazolecarboxamide formyltransferase/IMP cyclohydrolase